MRKAFAVAVVLLALAFPAAGARGNTSANQAPRITNASVGMKTLGSGRRTVDVRLTICDDSESVFEGGTRLRRGALLLEQRLFRRRTLWAFLRSYDPMNFTRGCFRYRLGYVPSEIFSGTGARYAIIVRVRDPEGRTSNAVRRSWSLP
jgi:hypothetical protein